MSDPESSTKSIVSTPASRDEAGSRIAVRLRLCQRERGSRLLDREPTYESPAMSFVARHLSLGVAAWPKRTALIVASNLLLLASAKAQVPFWPVPMTMQTYVVLSMAALLGWRMAATSLAAYLAEGALGLPVFAGTPAHGIGLAYIAGPTGGYLFGYLAAAVIVGCLAGTQRWGRSAPGLVAAMLAGELAILGTGYCWLALQLGWERALVVGVAPFVPGDGLKLVLAIGTIGLLRPLRFVEP